MATLLIVLVKVSLTQWPGIFLVGVVLCNWAAEHNMSVFSKLFLVVCWQGRLSRG